MSNNTSKILLVQLFSNGDCLYATAIARQIKHDFPDCHLTWAIADFCKSIIAGNPYVDEVRIVSDVPKSDVVAFRKFKRKLYKEKKEGRWDQIFITQGMDNNQALYDGTIRGMILRAYPYPVTVPVEPVLILSEKEKLNCAAFAEKYKLRDFKNVILWEYAPQSGQSALTFENVIRVAKKITAMPGTCVILSSANAFVSTGKIFDGSSLSVRENAGITHYCHLLIGCSSGITWLNTSSASSHLPMLQLLNPDAAFLNAPSADFKRYEISPENLIEMFHFDEQNIFDCIKTIFETDFTKAKQKFNEALPLQFNTTRKVVYNMLCYLQFTAIAKHYRLTTSIYGKHPLFLKQFRLAIFTFPVTLLKNIIRKKIISNIGA